MQDRKNITGHFPFIILLILSLLLTGGCWDRRELDERGFIAGFALDKGKQSNQIMATAQIIDPSQVASGKNSKGGGKPFFLVSSEGPTIFYVIRHLNQYSSRKLTYDHNQVFIFGEDLAVQGINKYLDLFMRDTEIRKNNLVMVAEGKGAEILKITTPLSPIPALYIDKLIKEDIISNSETMATTFIDFSQRVMSRSTAPVASLISIRTGGTEKKLHISGMAVFNRELKMVGKLNGTETRGLLWVLGKVQSGIILIKPGKCNNSYSMEITKASSKIIPRLENGTPQITVKISISSNLGEAGCPDDLLQSAIWSTMEKQQTQAIRREILMALNRAQALNADIFGFGDAFYKKYPSQWRQIGPHWQEIFPELKVDVVVESKVESPSLTVKAFTGKGG